MRRILAVSDVHGEVEKLERVLEDAQYDPTKDQLVLLGDYIDRGPHSKEVIELVMELVEEGAIALKGNHEDMWFQAFLEEDWDEWIQDIGLATFHSYEGDIDLMKEHIHWLRKHLLMYYETEDYIFVHAGLEPETPLEWQDEEIMLWIRNYDRIDLGKIVVHGHTPVRNVEQVEDQLFIDTGASMGGKLSLVELPSMIVYEE